ncbi:MAG: tRNA dihydrouridine synthase DusB [Bacteroidota bacterium]
MKIGHAEFGKHPLFLAPMEDVTDPSFRFMCKKFGADLMYTEFISSDGLIRGGKKGVRKLAILDEERPVGIQLYGHNTGSMVEAALIAEEAKPDLIDLNFGCPVKKISNRGAGAGMLRDVPKMIEMTEKIVKAVKLPVTAKTRLGWDHDSINVIEVAERLQDTGIAALTIHARTRSQLYTGTADWTWIGKVKNNPAMHIPVIGNGDIDSPEKALEMFNRYGVDAVMVGRATIGQPWILAEIRHYLDHGERKTPLSIGQKVEIAKEHLTKSMEWKGDRAGVLTMRRHLALYFKFLPHFREMKIRLLTAATRNEVEDILDEIVLKYKNNPEEI